ncbi:unnamed protein product [Adineta ricciae]|uniref:Uncharacterized protein n=2 Tax=Adineta ricciae TaxID=249248 RepID=A0A815GW10_ADIRI|nr:unnamed protein product [Adineta ricciae]
MMFILLIIFLINNGQSFEWNCTVNKHSLFSNDQTTEQCTILIEYLSLQQDKQICTTHTLAVRNLPLYSLLSDYTMRTFQVTSCQLLTLSQLPFSLPSSLETLDLSSNLLSTFVLSYPIPLNLKYLYLDSNPNLRYMKFGHNQQLIGLSLRHNQQLQLSSLPRNLIQLDLTNCSLAQSSLMSIVKSLKRLTHLSLVDNQLERLPVLDRSIELEYLNLSNNALTTIDDHWLHKSLRILDLRFNQIKSMEFCKERLKINETGDESSHQSSNVNTLQLVLYGNPLVCDCWLNSLLNSTAVNITDLSYLQCNSRSILHVPSSDFQCYYTRHCAPDCSCCDFEACDCHSVCPSECLCSHDTLWSHHVVKCRQKDLLQVHSLLPETITELSYEENHIEHIKPFVFVGKTFLTKVNFAKNHIRNLTNETFCAATNLEEINLSYNSNLMQILPNLNELFACLKHLQYVILSNEQVNDGETISFGWKIEQSDDLIYAIRTTELSTTVLPEDITLSTTSIQPASESIADPAKFFSIFHQDSYTASNLIQHNQTLIVIVFFLLFFVLLFLLLLISLAICRRKLRHHITTELERQRAQHYYYHPTLHQPINKAPESLPVNDSLYEQLPSLSSDSEQPFLCNDKKLMNVNAPALPPYPPSFRHYHCCHSGNAHEYLSTMKGYSSPNLQQQHQACQAVLIVGSQLIYPNHQECISELQQNLLLNQSENNPIHYCNNEPVFVPTTLCRCQSQMKQSDAYVCPNI